MRATNSACLTCSVLQIHFCDPLQLALNDKLPQALRQHDHAYRLVRKGDHRYGQVLLEKHWTPSLLNTHRYNGAVQSSECIREQGCGRGKQADSRLLYGSILDQQYWWVSYISLLLRQALAGRQH